MPHLYNISVNKDGSYHFINDHGQVYIIYFLEYILLDADGNQHQVFNFGFTRNSNHSSKKFLHKFDEKIMNTIVFIVNEFFAKNGDKCLLYFCFSDDGFGRHRSITFKKWCRNLNRSIESYQKKISSSRTTIYGSCLITIDNPLKKLILNAFEANMDELSDIL